MPDPAKQHLPPGCGKIVAARQAERHTDQRHDEEYGQSQQSIAPSGQQHSPNSHHVKVLFTVFTLQFTHGMTFLSAIHVISPRTIQNRQY
jgi:hypothetical protein